MTSSVTTGSDVTVVVVKKNASWSESEGDKLGGRGALSCETKTRPILRLLLGGCSLITSQKEWKERVCPG